MPSREEENEVKPLLLTIALPWWRCKAFPDILKTRRKKKKQDKHLVVLWIIRIFATDTLDYHQNQAVWLNTKDYRK